MSVSFLGNFYTMFDLARPDKCQKDKGHKSYLERT